MIAEVRAAQGRYHLFVTGLVLATEGDRCRDATVPQALLDPIPPEELAVATIGGTPASQMDPKLVRFFRGAHWNEAMLKWAAAEINRSAPLWENKSDDEERPDGLAGSGDGG